MKTFFYWLKSQIRLIFRKLYWLYRFSKANKGKNLDVKFPVIIEGSGSVEFGDGCRIDSNVRIACSAGSKIIFGKNCRIDKNVRIITGKGAEIIFGDDCWIMENTIIRSNGSKFVFGDKVVIATNVQIFSRESGYEGNLTVGSGTHINDFAMLDVSGDLTIGEQVAFGQFSIVFTHDHFYADKTKPAWKGGVITGKVSIEDWAWVGAKVVILHNTVIGRRSVIASGAVVNQNCEPETIYGGVPAKVLKKIE